VRLKRTPDSTEVVDREGPHRLVSGFRLSVVSGPDAGLAFTSAGSRVVIGKDATAQLVLTDRTVSHFHCEIAASPRTPDAEGDGVLLRDLGSRNGTLVDGVQVLSAPLRKAALLTLGKTQVRFEPGAEPVRIRLSAKDRFGSMVGRSAAARACFAVLERAAEGDATVLLEGETGTGKEAAAESLHQEGARREGPLIVVDCGAIPEDLLESELFGHEKGAFTGAAGAREGAFEAAEGGTIFLDEIGELASSLQPKLLRVLERKEVKRVGGNRYQAVNVRVIAATNRDLLSEVNAGRFRSDLYYRLAVVQVRLPTLRERAEDLPMLVEHFMTSLGAADRPEAAALRTREFMSELSGHAWPGNVRELRNYLERCLTLRESVPLPATQFDSPLSIDSTKPLREARDAWTRALERRYLEEVLKRSGGNVSAAARAAKVDRIHFYRLLWRHGIR
jgi:two-component system response regulator GlrR